MNAENDLPGSEFTRTWNWSVLPDPIPQFACEHLSVSGLTLRSVVCGICGLMPMRRVVVA